MKTILTAILLLLAAPAWAQVVITGTFLMNGSVSGGGGGGSGTPGGSDTQIQYNNAGVFGGTTATYNNSTGAFTFPGINVYAGSQVLTANPMGALAIDVTKGLNTKTISADSTFTFSGTPATANTFFSFWLTNSDSGSHVITIPSSFSLNSGTTVTSFTIAGSGREYLTWRYNGSTYEVMGVPGTTTGTGATVLQTSPTLITPTIGAALATTVNGLTITSTTGTLTVTNGKTLAASNTLTMTGTDGSSVAFGTGGTVAYTSATTGVIYLNVGDGTNVITTGEKVTARISVPFACTISGNYTMFANTSTTTVVDVWKDTYANYPATDSDSITAAAPPTITAATKSTATTATWTLAIAAGDQLGFNVDSNNNAAWIMLAIPFTRP